MNCLIVDDNQMARDAIRHLAGQIDDLRIAGECSNALEAYNLISSKTIDIVFLDVEMPELSGLELTGRLANRKPVVILITSKQDYALDAFALNVADYIMKPVTPTRFLQALDKARSILPTTRWEESTDTKQFVFIRDGGMLKRLLIEDIHFLEAMGDYVKVYTQQKFYAVHITLKKIEEQLPSLRFLRVHRSFIVALNKVERIEEGVIIINNKPVPVADIYRSTLNKRLNIVDRN